MADGHRPDNQAPRDVPPAQLGGDRLAGQLEGIAPAVVSAFFQQRGAAPSSGAPSAGGAQPREAPTSPRAPTSFGALPDLDPEAVRQRNLKLQHLALMLAARPAPSASPPKAPPPAPAPAPEALREAHLRLRQGAGRGHRHTGALGSRATSDLSHGAGPGPAREPHPPPGNGPGTGRLEALVGQALGAEGVLALRQAVAVLEDRGLPARLGALTEQVTALVPGDDGVVRLGADVSKRLIVNNLNPVLALSVAARESAQQLERLRRWEALTPRERLTATTNLTANLAEMVGAVTPPPVNVGAQLAAAGLQLVSLASEHGETLEGVARQAADAEPARRVLGEVAEQGVVLAHRVQAAWGELSERLRRAPPRAPAVLQRLFDSRWFRHLKRHPVSRGLARGMENLTYNLTQRCRVWRERWAHRWQRDRR
ncbi:MAG: hypothetical protein VKQ33_02240 [Candidatus Sericytochromatia bacterium]|nr:hypothetical protein [Candidatus Sericytochromatia bacterium]